MEASSANDNSIRVLCLGNDILGDDAFGLLVAAELRRRLEPDVSVRSAATSGLHLLDEILDVDRLLVIDTVVTHEGEPGTLRMFHEREVQVAPGGSPHSSGLFDVLAEARRLTLPVPEEIVFLVMEGHDCTTVGGSMHPDVLHGVAQAVELAVAAVARWQSTASRCV